MSERALGGADAARCWYCGGPVDVGPCAGCARLESVIGGPESFVRVPGTAPAVLTGAIVRAVLDGRTAPAAPIVSRIDVPIVCGNRLTGPWAGPVGPPDRPAAPAPPARRRPSGLYPTAVQAANAWLRGIKRGSWASSITVRVLGGGWWLLKRRSGGLLLERRIQGLGPLSVYLLAVGAIVDRRDLGFTIDRSK